MQLRSFAGWLRAGQEVRLGARLESHEPAGFDALVAKLSQYMEPAVILGNQPEAQALVDELRHNLRVEKKPPTFSVETSASRDAIEQALRAAAAVAP